MRASFIKIDLVIIFFLTISLLSLRWVMSYVDFPDEGFVLRAIHEVYDSSYFPLIKSFSSLNFNPSYNPEIQNLNMISFPFLSLLPNIFFYKIFGIYSFLIIEFFSVFLFLLIFYKIFCSMKMSKISSLLFSLILFSIPHILHQLTFLNIDLINKINLNLSTFYGLRNPRPLISNLYLFTYFYYLIQFFYLKQRTIKNYLIIGVIIGLSLHTFFYFFIFEVFLLLILYLVFFKYKVFTFLNDNFKSHVILFSIVLLFTILFILQINFSEYDYKERMGIIYMDVDKKKIMLDYLFNFLLQLEFILLLIVNTIFFLFFKKKIFQIFYFFFISTIFSTIFFISLSPSSMDYYHFFNWILTSGTVSLCIVFLYFFDKSIISLQKINKQKLIATLIILLILINYNLSYDLKSNNNNNNSRKNLDQLTKFIQNDEILSKKDNEILTLNYRLFLWLALNDFNNFYIVPNSFWTSKKTSIIENELITTFKFLNLSDDDFVDFFKNVKTGYRYNNINTKTYFERLYLANKLRTYSDISNFNIEHQSFIKKTSPLYSHQSIIPNNEFLRFKNKFNKLNKEINSKIVILDNSDKIINKHFLNPNNYCLRYKNIKYLIYISTSIINDCKLVKN